MDDCATVDVAFTAHASAPNAAPDRALATLGGFDALDLAAPDATTPCVSNASRAAGSCTGLTDADTAPHVATPCVSATSVAASASAHATAHATASDVSIAPAIATLGSTARGTKRKASDDSSENFHEPWGQRPARVQLLVKQHSSIYHAPCEH